MKTFRVAVHRCDNIGLDSLKDCPYLFITTNDALDSFIKCNHPEHPLKERRNAGQIEYLFDYCPFQEWS